MKNILFTSFVICFFTFFCKAQLKDLTITPGIGIGKLKLGISEKQAIALLGKPSSWAGYKNTMLNYKENAHNFAIDSMLVFVQGFDSLANYENGAGNTPIMNLFFKAHRLVYISVSSYIGEEDFVQKVKLINGIKFKDELKKIKPKMKTFPLSVKYGDMSADLIYYKEGIELMFDKNKLTFIGIFPKLSNYPERIQMAQERLLKEFNE